uniref:CSON003705 protein n=1 Tax=Culicoides sonorensis TaxID=179676 RepID=A0A336LIE0_CULSO
MKCYKFYFSIFVFSFLIKINQTFLVKYLDHFRPNNASLGQFPYMASLRNGDIHFCSGVIFSPRWIITSGSCSYNLRVINAVLVGDKKGVISNDLLYVNVSIISKNACSNLQNVYFIHDNMICTKTVEDQRFCIFESGSPLILNNELVGISYLADACKFEGNPSIFEMVHPYKKWILQELQSTNARDEENKFMKTSKKISFEFNV